MKKLVVILFLLCSTLSYAQCVTTQKTVGYFDPQRFLAVDRVLNFSEAQGIAMLQKDIAAGVAVLINAGTKLSMVTKYNDFISFCDVNDYRLILLNDHFKCK